MRSKGLHHSREVNRAHVLWCLDQNVPESQIMAVLGIGRTTVWRTRLAYLEGGLKLALFDLKRSGGPCKYDTDDEARVVALACSAALLHKSRTTSVLMFVRTTAMQAASTAISCDTDRVHFQPFAREHAQRHQPTNRAQGDLPCQELGAVQRRADCQRRYHGVD
ncbi:helix-turn-helix domain-containing protein [Verminephrobacter aporrectodeae]|uniref:helix-turn-helix domain-containing protein n=1 Tax=Verminephrobacter aporrectodeae TaxID=1110389 RepID=UPI002244AC1B|nr:helix-turn-helix domain-containing protein [Verminephrobacter aporrectodeae]